MGTLKDKKKGYIVLGYNKEKNKYYGYVENSFSMGASDCRVQVNSAYKDPYRARDYERDFKLGAYNNYCKTHNLKPRSYNEYLWFVCRCTAIQLNRQKFEGCEWKAYRIHSKGCPVNVDMSEVCKMRAKKMQYSKFAYRNQPFSLK